MRPKLPDFLIDLYDVYGVPAHPHPRGAYYLFKVVDNNTTYEKALRRITAFFREHELEWASLSIQPGPEQPKPFNRAVQFAVLTSLLIPRRSHLP